MLDNLGQIMPRGAKRFGRKTAFVCGERSFTFLEMEELSARLGNALRGLGVERGDRVTPEY